MVELEIFKKKFYISEKDKEKYQLIVFTLKLLDCKVVNFYYNQKNIKDKLIVSFTKKYDNKRARIMFVFNDKNQVCQTKIQSSILDDKIVDLDEAFDVLTDYF